MARRWRPLQAGMLGTVYFMANHFSVPTLKASDPAANALLDEAPYKIAITFAAPPDPDKSSIGLFQNKRMLEVGGVTSESNNVLSVEVRAPAMHGRYKVRWKSVCLCSGEKSAHGSFEFTVK